jgi:hypothetical protein
MFLASPFPFNPAVIPFVRPRQFASHLGAMASEQLPNPSESLLIHLRFLVGKTNKFNDRNHAGLADGTAVPEDHLPVSSSQASSSLTNMTSNLVLQRYFAKSGHVGEDPKKMKKNGGGKGGWYARLEYN